MTGTSDPELSTTAGQLRGTTQAGLAVFRGVPYAQPPVGALRFAAPRPMAPWTGVRPARRFGPPPPQGGALSMGALAQEATGEDWLTLNVWSPDPGPGAGLPVLVWIPGGAYQIGSSNLPEFDGARLAAGGAVVVTLNYRLGLEGFGLVEGAPANRGLLDQVAALHWVRDNIRAFGGDPGRVTIFGQSAGGGSVAMLLAMPRAAGLFRRAVAQSVPGLCFTTELAAEIAAACAAEFGVRATVAELSAVEPELLPAACDEVSANIGRWARRWGLITYRPMAVAPVVDGDVLPAAPWQALAAGAGRDVDLLVGHTRDEHRLLSLIDGVLGRVTDAQAEAALEALAPGADGPRRYREAYPDATAEQLYETVNADWLFRMPSLHLAQAHAAAGGRTHLYELTWPAPGMGGALGACHGLDIPLVFGNLSSGGPGMLIGAPAPAEAGTLSDRMRAAWTTFAGCGEPGWPQYEADGQLTQRFDAEPAVVAYPESASQTLWHGHTFAALPLHMDGDGDAPGGRGRH